jgi:proteasome accessory factor A
MENKIRGVEQELAMNTQPQLPHRSLIYLVGMAIEELKKQGFVSQIRVEEPSLDFMAYNGFRVYDDMSHLELSSPSYNHPIEAVIYDRVAEIFGYYAVKGLRSYFKSINVYKNNVSNQKIGEGWRSNAYSTHSSILMNYGTCNLNIWDRLEEKLIPYMVARIPLIGGGDYVAYNTDGLLPKAGKYMHGNTLNYVISPRAAFIKRISSNDTVDARGILNQRNDPHADPQRYWRLHDINWEALRSPFQIYLRDSLEVLVMTAYERGYLKDSLKLKNPVKALREITIDTEEFNWKLELEDGSKIDAIGDIMIGYYLTGIEKMLEEEGSTEEDRKCFDLLEATLDAYDARKLEYFINGIDWVTKKALIDEHAEKNLEIGVVLCNQYALLDDTVLEYIDEISNTTDIQTTYDHSSSMDFVRDAVPWEDWENIPRKIKYGLMYGPIGSRDYLRCLVVREFQGLLDSVEWESINFYNAKIKLDDPFLFNKEMCGDLLENSTNTFTEFTIALDKLNREKQNIQYAPSDDYEKFETEI